jgi:hypothetical protein
MPEENPYAPPVADPGVLGRLGFREISTKELKRLRNDSHSIRSLAFLICLGICVLLGVIVAGIATTVKTPHFLIQGSLVALSVAAAVGLIKRPNWGRVVGFILSSFMLLGFPIGTIIGILCMIALARGGRLFGPERLLHKDLETEWKYRKRNKIA